MRRIVSRPAEHHDLIVSTEELVMLLFEGVVLVNGAN